MIGPRLKILLIVIFALFALMVVNSVYLVAIRMMGLATQDSYENWFYLIMFLAHLVVGLLLLESVFINDLLCGLIRSLEVLVVDLPVLEPLQ